MQPEPLSWENQKDFFKEKKLQQPPQQQHDRLSSDAAVGSAGRWREGAAHHGSRDSARGGSADGRPSTGLSRQDSCHVVLPEDSVHGCTPTRSSERMVEEEIPRPPAAHTDGRYGRTNRVENKGSFINQKDWKGNHRHHNSWEASDAHTVDFSGGELHGTVIAHRSVDDLLAYASHPHSDTENSSMDPLHFKDHHPKVCNIDGFSTGHIYDKDLAWKPRMWMRSGSLSSRGSSFSHSTSSKSIQADSDDGRFELPQGKATPITSPSGDGGVGVTSAVPLEETSSRKKQRLGWGQGLAKYEKQKVEGPDEATGKNGSHLSSINTKTVHSSVVLSLPDGSPKLIGVLDCTSPATPSSVGCSSSPEAPDKPYLKVGNSDIDASQFSDSPGHEFRHCPEELSINLEHMELNPIKNISSLLAHLLQQEDATSGDSSFVRSTALNKLRLLKTDFSEALVKTQSEIDLYENELKSLDKDSEIDIPCSVASTPILPCKEQTDSASNIGELLQHNEPSENCVQVKIKNIDSPGTVSSKCPELLSPIKEACTSDMVKLDEYSEDCEASRSAGLDGQDIMLLCNGKSSTALNDGYSGTCLYQNSTSLSLCPGESLYREEDNAFAAFILASNKESARNASEVFDKVFPTIRPEVDSCRVLNAVACRQNVMLIKEKLTMLNHFQKFKHRVLTLKFRAFHHLWKEDMRLLSLRKYRAKSQKRSEPNCRPSNGGHQKNRSSIRSRFISPGNLTLVPTTEIVEFTSKLLADSQSKVCRNNLKMPALILNEERRHSRFITNNGLVEDPCAVEKERLMINPWTPEEKEIFLEKLATFGKDFTKIASFLSHKTTADCIEFYYKNHKSESFEKVKKRSELRKQGRCFTGNTYLVTSGKKWNREVNAASLDMLGAVAAHADDSSRKTQQACSGRSILGGYYEHKISGQDGVLEGASCNDIPGTESEAAAADVLASICGGLSSEAMSSCITSSVDPPESFQEWRGQKINHMAADRPFMPDVSHNIDEEDTCSDESCGNLDSVDWTDDEKATFIMALRSYGKDFANISCCVRTKSRDQCKIFFSKARKCLGLDEIHPGPDNEGTPMSDASGGRSDTEDACLMETDSAICCSTQSCSKLDVDLVTSVVTTKSNEVCGMGNSILPQLEADVSSGKDDAGVSNSEEVDTGRIEEVDTGRIEEVDHGGGSLQPSEAMPESHLDGNGKLLKGDECQPSAVSELEVEGLGGNESAQPHESADSLPDSGCKEHETCKARSHASAELISTTELAQSSSNDVIEVKQEVEPITASEGLESKLNPQLPTAATISLDDSKIAEAGASESHNCSNSPHSPILESTTSRNSSDHPQVVDSTCPGFNFVPNHENRTPLELQPPHERKSLVISWPQNGKHPPEPTNAALQNSSTTVRDYEDSHSLCQPITQSVTNFEQHGNNQHQKSDYADFCQLYVPSQILKGYPLCVVNKNEMNGELPSICEKPVLQNFEMVSKNSHSNQFLFVPDSYHDKCSSSKSLHMVSSEHPFLPRSHGMADGQLGSHSQNLDKQAVRSSGDASKQSTGTGDVKLFGKILSNPLPLKNCPQEQDGDDATSTKSNKSLVSSKFSEHTTDATSVSSKKLQLNGSGCLNLEEFPMKTYGYWDGNRIQTGFSTLPDSANYPAVISNYPTPACRIDQRPMATVVRRSDPSLGCLSVLPNKETNGNGGLADLRQVYGGTDGSRHGTNVQPFSVEVKRRQDISELQKRNGFETMLGFQQQSMGVIGMNVVGGGGILVGSCTGVSDPVAALKMHFATEARFSSGSGSVGIIREEEASWGRDVGR